MKQSQRGIALITVILMLLVLTAMGIGVVVLMTQEDRIASQQELQKASLFAAEIGLRRGEGVFALVENNNAKITAFLQWTASGSNPAVEPHVPQLPDAGPGAQTCGTVGATTYSFVAPSRWDLRHLGTFLNESNVELVNQEVPLGDLGGGLAGRTRAFYSVYVRNNPDDLIPGLPCSDPRQNWDSRARLVSVGYVTGPGGLGGGATAVLATKIIEEEWNWTGVAQSATSQYGVNAATTGGGIYEAQDAAPAIAP